MSGAFGIPDGLIVKRPLQGRGKVTLDYRRFARVEGGRVQHVTEDPAFAGCRDRIVTLHDVLMQGQDPLLFDGKVCMTGWKTTSPFVSDDELDAIQSAATKLREIIDVYASDGIGGSFLGLEAVLRALYGSLELFNQLSLEQRGGVPQIRFFGQHMDAAEIVTNLILMIGKRVGVNVISKSGGTVEPAIGFAILKHCMDHSFADAVQRIVATTDIKKGALRKLADEVGYRTFPVPDDVGGRFSVTSPVGLFGLAVCGVDIHAFIAGARDAEMRTRTAPFDSNPAMIRATTRNVAHTVWGKDIEVMSTGIKALVGLTEFDVQLFPESQGKHGKGLFLAPEFYTSQAHANGQLVKDGKRNLIETFLGVETTPTDIVIPGEGTPVSYLNGKLVSEANNAFLDGLRDDHYAGGVPTSAYVFSHVDPYALGYWTQLELNAVALDTLAQREEPFTQKDVEGYKICANARSGKPGTEAELARMLAADARLNPAFIV